MRVNREIRAPRVRVIGPDGEQVGVLSVYEAIQAAEKHGLDLVEVAPNAVPPVCKIIDFGKFRYDQTKREKESKKAQHQIKVKEIKLKPNIDKHDLQTKIRQARGFIEKGNKVRITCMPRGREMIHPEFAEEIVQEFCLALEDLVMVEAPMKWIGRMLQATLAPAPGGPKKKAAAPKVAEKA